MTDLYLVHKKLARLEASVTELRALTTPADIASDLKEERFAEHTLQIAIQCLIDVAQHIVSDDRLGVAETAHDLITLLTRHGWVPSEQRAALGRMVGFRNRLVHQYETIEPARVAAIVADHLDDLLAFATAIRQRLATFP